MSSMASQITSLTIVYSTIYSRVDQRKHQSSASLAFVPVNSPHKGPVTREMFPLDDVIMMSRGIELAFQECCILVEYLFVFFSSNPNMPAQIIIRWVIFNSMPYHIYAWVCQERTYLNYYGFSLICVHYTLHRMPINICALYKANGDMIFAWRKLPIANGFVSYRNTWNGFSNRHTLMHVYIYIYIYINNQWLVHICIYR